MVTTFILICVLSFVVSVGLTAGLEGHRVYLRGQQDARLGKPLFVSYDPRDPIWTRLYFSFWDWCERKGHEAGR